MGVLTRCLCWPDEAHKALGLVGLPHAVHLHAEKARVPVLTVAILDNKRMRNLSRQKLRHGLECALDVPRRGERKEGAPDQLVALLSTETQHRRKCGVRLQDGAVHALRRGAVRFSIDANKWRAARVGSPAPKANTNVDNANTTVNPRESGREHMMNRSKQQSSIQPSTHSIVFGGKTMMCFSAFFLLSFSFPVAVSILTHRSNDLPIYPSIFLSPPHLTVYAMPIDVIMNPDRKATSISLMPATSLAAVSSPPLLAAVREVRKSMAHCSTVFIVRLAFDESSVLGSKFWSSESRSLV